MKLITTFSGMDDVLASFFQRLLRQRLLWFPQLALDGNTVAARRK